MAAFLYPLYTGASLALAIWSVGLFQDSWSLEKFLLLAVLAGLIYDNITISAGSLLGEGELLKALNMMRFLLHNLLSPLLVLIAFELEYQTRAVGDSHAGIRSAVWALASGLILFGTVTKFFGLQLSPETYAGTLRYRAVNSGSGFPILEIGIVLLVALVGISLWQNIQCPWLFAGSLVMLVGGALPIKIVGPAVSSGAEILLILSLLATECALTAGQTF